ncbi:unnamed protein product [Trichobilharzia szidati]|nr:unnamed protein product [Trichobilharzia szidati]
MPGTEIQINRLSLGTKISLMTHAQYRYEGTVVAINSIEGTLTLQNVKFWGTENRISPNGTNQNAENKEPAVGTVFDSITFWMSSINQMRLLDDMKTEQNELGDKAVVKAAVAIDGSRGTGRRQRNWWYESGDQQRFMRVTTPSASRNISNLSTTSNRFNNSSTQHVNMPQPRMLVSYPRRGRNQLGFLSRQMNYVPVVPIAPTTGNLHKSNHPTTIRNPPFRIMTTPIPPSIGPYTATRSTTGRKPSQTIRRNLSSNVRRYTTQSPINPRGGVYVYLPPEVTTTYHPRSINLVQSRMGMNRRRITDRRGAPRGNVTAQSDIDCSKPYDFETANAELEAELAKINLNTDSVSSERIQPQDHDSLGIDQAASTGDGVACVKPPISSTLSDISVTAVSTNGASGDTSSGSVSSNIPNNTNEVHAAENQTSNETIGILAKGEYYVREKCFFDQISRSEGGPRGPMTSYQNGQGNYQYTSNSHYHANSSSATLGHTTNASSNLVGVNSASAAARRERQLNLETFGPMAARTTFISRRRPTGSVPRDMLVSASA